MLMIAFALQTIRKLTFGYEEIAAVLGITLASARVTATRYVRTGLLIRLKRNCYMLRDSWSRLEPEQKFTVASLLQTPSYISLMTALTYYEITTQVQQDFIESAALQRTRTFNIESTAFAFTKLQPNLFHHFSRVKNFFIAAPEKALLDALYLQGMGKYRLDVSSLDIKKIDRKNLEALADFFPEKVKHLCRRLYDEF